MDNIFKEIPQNSWDYKNDIILAPMVKVGTLPMRILSLKYGATMVYSPEYIDKCMILCKRNVNNNGFIEYIAPSDQVIFRTYKDEPLAFQLGTADATLALQAVNNIIKDVKAIDINMGCPLPFSTKGGMGTALLKNPELISDILKTLKRNINIPLTCKIRLLDKLENSVNLVNMIEKLNVNAIGLHARFIHDRSKKERAKHDQTKFIKSVMNIPLLANGDIYSLDDAIKLKEKTNADSVMIARGAQYNPTIFRNNGFLPIYDAMNEYVNVAEYVDNKLNNSKYVIKSMVGHILKDNDKLNICNTVSNYNDLRDFIEITKSYDLIVNKYTPIHKIIF